MEAMMAKKNRRKGLLRDAAIVPGKERAYLERWFFAPPPLQRAKDVIRCLEVDIPDRLYTIWAVLKLGDEKMLEGMLLDVQHLSKALAKTLETGVFPKMSDSTDYRVEEIKKAALHLLETDGESCPIAGPILVKALHHATRQSAKEAADAR
jgi:hypothetical protein